MRVIEYSPDVICDVSGEKVRHSVDDWGEISLDVITVVFLERLHT